MANAANRGLLTLGAFCIILVICIVLGVGGLVNWYYVPPLIIALFGCWVLALASMQASNPQKYERSAFALFSWGILLVAFGGAWLLFAFNYLLYSLALVLLVIGALAIAAALRRK